MSRPPQGGAWVRLLGGFLAAALAFGGCTVRRVPVGTGPPFLHVAAVARLSDLQAVSPPAWAPDGRSVAFASQDAVWLVRVSPGGGRRERRLAPLPHVSQVAWASDGRTLAALARGMLSTVSLDGAPPRRVSDDDRIRLVGWDPARGRLAYVASHGARDDLRLASPPGAPVVLVSLPDTLEAQTLDWLPGGQGIWLAVGRRGRGRADRFLNVRVAGSRATSAFVGLRDSVRAPTLEPGGRFVAFVGGSDEEVRTGKGRVTVVRTDGTGRRVLTVPGAYSALSWSPSGTVLAYAEGGGDDIHLWIADVATGERLEVATYRPENPTPDGSLVVRWAADGLRLAFGTDTGDAAGPVWIATLVRF